MGRGLLIRFGIIAVILVGGFLIKQFVSGNAGDLSVGDCFDPPTATGVEVKDVQHHPCNEIHHGEVILVTKFTNVSEYPTDAVVTQFISDNCVPAYKAYTSLDLDSVEGADIGYFTPTANGWSKGDRGVICYATKAFDEPMQGSVKKK